MDRNVCHRTVFRAIEGSIKRERARYVLHPMGWCTAFGVRRVLFLKSYLF